MIIITIGASCSRDLPNNGSKTSYKLKKGTPIDYDRTKFNVKVNMSCTIIWLKKRSKAPPVHSL